MVYAFGERWGPEPATKDKYFGFLPGNGIHDIHMNQGNTGRFLDDDGVYQDGGVLVHFPDQHEWTAIFLKFQSQAWHTDDRTGHRITEPPPPPSGPPQPPGPPTAEEPDGLVVIVAALVNPTQSPEVEVVTLLNTAPHDIDLKGWALLDTQKKSLALSGVLSAGGTRHGAHPAAACSVQQGRRDYTRGRERSEGAWRVGTRRSKHAIRDGRLCFDPGKRALQQPRPTTGSPAAPWRKFQTRRSSQHLWRIAPAVRTLR